MATKLPRLNVVMEPYIYEAISKLAKRERLSRSLVARDLLREALVVYEDAHWDKEARAREKSLKRKKTISHHQVWSK
jgi:metal-responsive CopG/Arc/MetJ family transcriptional regulator